MQPITIFMDIESSRSYIDELYSSDAGKVLEALIALKNSVIGSNRQKSSVIQQGIVPRLLQLMSGQNMDSNIKLEATITIGSLAKGTPDNVALLIEQGAATALVDILKEVPIGTKLAEACLCALRSIFTTPPAPLSALPAEMRLLSRLTPRACVVRILSIWCTGAVEQEALCAAGACSAIAALLGSRGNITPSTAKVLPALDLLAAMCFENANVAQATLTTKVVFGALPCLARLCTKDMPEDIRATAAETLAYLAEVCTSRSCRHNMTS
ncbi:unnamed protein product [Leptidea sinapis]|uniref:Armadillo repeat-containing protein 8 n=1 Tax=Leptidea sinapis TaxID=189913 RepID=A0A5E4QZK6_9NEOP|nr:unnamed protein product [Leptidea sinapis]